MAITYSYRFDERYNVDALKKHISFAKFGWLGWPLKIVCAVGLLALAAIGIAAKIYVIISAAVLFLVLLALGPRLDYLVVSRRSRKHAEFGREISVELSDAKLKVSSHDSTADAGWTAFVKATAFSDGVMLYQSPSQYLWLPDSGLKSGRPSEVRTLVKSKITNFRGG